MDMHKELLSVKLFLDLVDLFWNCESWHTKWAVIYSVIYIASDWKNGERSDSLVRCALAVSLAICDVNIARIVFGAQACCVLLNTESFLFCYRQKSFSWIYLFDSFQTLKKFIYFFRIRVDKIYVHELKLSLVDNGAKWSGLI